MEYQKIISFWDNTLNQPSKFRAWNLVKINEELRWICNISNQTKFKTSIIRSNVYDYSDAYIYFKGTITVPNIRTAAAPNNRNKKAIFNCISEIIMQK